MNQSLAKWIEAHPYLLPVARVQELVARAAALPSGSAPAVAEAPPQGYAEEHARGVPLLRSESVTLDLGAAGEAFQRIVNALADAPDIAHELRAEARVLRNQLDGEPEARIEALR